MKKQAGKIDAAHFEGLLQGRRAELLGRIAPDASDERAAPDGTEGLPDVRDAADSSVYDVAEEDRLTDAQRASDRVRQIDAALRRIADGSYGTCLDCEEPISEARLRALPEAVRCVRCQESVDRQSGASHHATL